MRVCEHGRGVGVIVLRVGFWVDRGCIFFWSSIHNMSVVFLSVSYLFLLNVLRVQLFPNVSVCCVKRKDERDKLCIQQTQRVCTALSVSFLF